MSRRRLLVVAAVALVVRVVYDLIAARHYVPTADASHYTDLAANLVRGRGFSHPFPFLAPRRHPTAFRPPLYPLLLAGVYALGGIHLGLAQVLGAVLGAAAAVLAGVLATRYAGPRAGTVAGVLVAVHPALVPNDAIPLSDTLGLALLLGAVLLLGGRRTAWAGVVLGLLVLTRPAAQGLVVLLLLWALLRIGWRGALAIAVPAAVVVAPWVIRNQLQLHSPVLVTSNGFNLAALYSPQAKASGKWVDPTFDLRFRSIITSTRDEVVLDQRLRTLATDSLRDDPGQVVPVAWRNLGRTVEAIPERNDLAELADGRNLSYRYATLPVVWLVLGFGVAGLWTLRRTPGMTPLLLAVGYLTVVTILASPAAPRLRAPLDAACCIGVGALVARRTRA